MPFLLLRTGVVRKNETGGASRMGLKAKGFRNPMRPGASEKGAVCGICRVTGARLSRTPL
jgi:hypothetical protein